MRKSATYAKSSETVQQTWVCIQQPLSRPFLSLSARFCKVNSCVTPNASNYRKYLENKVVLVFFTKTTCKSKSNTTSDLPSSLVWTVKGCITLENF